MPQPTSPPAHKPDMPAISLPQLTSAVRLFDDADCRRHIHKCARASPSAPRKDCQVCVASHPAWPRSRPLAQETGKHDRVTRTTSEHSCSTCQGARSHADARSRLRIVSFASHARVEYVRCLSHSLTAPYHNKLNPILMMMSSGFYWYTADGQSPRCSRQKGRAGYFPDYIILPGMI